MDEIKAFVNRDNNTVIVCPGCGARKSAKVEKFRGKKHSLKVKCPCGNQFAVHLDFRKHYRKPTDLDGFYKKKKVNLVGYFVNLSRGDEWQEDEGHTAVNCMIKNISMGGIGIVLLGHSVVQEDDELRIQFVLDNKKKTEVNRNVVVVSISENVIGCQFTESMTHDKDLGFYLMP